MTMTSPPQTVLEKALALKAESIRLRQGAAAEEQALQASQRIDDLETHLNDLEALLRTISKLRELDVTLTVDLPKLKDAYATFARRSATGLPDSTAFTTAKKRLRKDISGLRDILSTLWSGWAVDRISALPQLRIAMLPVAQQSTERDRLRDLNKLARISVPSLTDVAMFATQLESLSDSLADVADPSADLVALVDRLGQRTVTLDDISDDQIALLRRYGLASQIQLHRRSV